MNASHFCINERFRKFCCLRGRCTWDAHVCDGPVSALAVSAHLHQVILLHPRQIDGLLLCGVQRSAGLPLLPVQDLRDNRDRSRAGRVSRSSSFFRNTVLKLLWPLQCSCTSTLMFLVSLSQNNSGICSFLFSYDEGGALTCHSHEIRLLKKPKTITMIILNNSKSKCLTRNLTEMQRVSAVED